MRKPSDQFFLNVISFKKNIYIKPVFKVYYIKLENGLAVGSANLRTTDSSNQVFDEWETINDREQDINW